MGVKFSLLGSSLLVRYYDFHKLCKTGLAKEKNTIALGISSHVEKEKTTFSEEAPD